MVLNNLQGSGEDSPGPDLGPDAVLEAAVSRKHGLTKPQRLLPRVRLPLPGRRELGWVTLRLKSISQGFKPSKRAAKRAAGRNINWSL